MHLGENPALGESRAEAAVAAYRTATEYEWAFGDEAGAQTDLALACITSSAQRIHAALPFDAHRGGAAAGLREEIEAFTATPTSVLVR